MDDVTTYQGRLDARGIRIAIVVSRFNELVTRPLLAGALDALRRHGADPADLSVVWVPGAFELPQAARRLAHSGQFEAVVCLGAVIRGATAHFDYVASQTSSGLARAALEVDVPIAFGVLTTDTLEQALERAGSKGGNKGADAALVAVEMVDLLRQLPAVGADRPPGPPRRVRGAAAQGRRAAGS